MRAFRATAAIAAVFALTWFGAMAANAAQSNAAPSLEVVARVV